MSRWRCYVVGLLLAGVIACQPKEEPVTYALTDEQLANLMLDMQLADAALGEVNGLERDSMKTLLNLRMEELYKHTMPALETEIRKLEDDPEKLNLVMDRVQTLMDSIR